MEHQTARLRHLRRPARDKWRPVPVVYPRASARPTGKDQNRVVVHHLTSDVSTKRPLLHLHF